MQEIEKILLEFKIDRQKGVLNPENRKLLYGRNAIAREKKFVLLKIFLRQLINPLNIILAVAGMAMMSVKEYVDAVVISGAISINIIFATIQEFRTNKTFQKLNKQKKLKALVKRYGKKEVISFGEVVVGDLVFLRAGDKIPADVVIIDETDCLVDESSFTGEADDVKKKRGDKLFSHSIITKGVAEGIVVAVGRNTEFGKILTELNSIKKRKPIIIQRMEKISLIMGGVAFSAVAVIVLWGIKNNYDSYFLLVMAISGVVAAIPEGLPVAILAILSVGMYRLLKKGILVKSLSSVETMVSVDTLLVDKTGTLTEGNMSMKDIFLNSKSKINQIMFLKYGLLATDVVFDEKHQKFVGDEMDIAIAEKAKEKKILLDKIEKEHQTIRTIPFSSENKYFAKITQEVRTGKYFIFVKGAPELLLDKNSILNEREKKKWYKILKAKQEAGHRFLAFAYKEIDHLQAEVDFSKLNFIGLISFVDPLKKAVNKTLATVRRIGLDMIILTGDSKDTAQAVAWRAGMLNYKDSKIIEGKELVGVSDEELYELIQEYKIFARVTPQDKLRISKVLLDHQHIVAMTGDGVNDVLALTKADIGISFVDSTDATKEAASVILKKNDFSLILLTIRQARNTIENIRKTVIYLLSSSFTEILVILGALLINGSMPFLPVHLLWVNIAEGGLMNFAFVFGENKINLKRKFIANIFTPTIKWFIFLISLFDALMLFSLYLFLLNLQIPVSKLQSLMFLALSLDFILVSYIVNNFRRKILTKAVLKNRYLNFSIMTGIGLIALAVLSEKMRGILRLEKFSLVEVLGIICFVIIDAAIVWLLSRMMFKTEFITHRKERRRHIRK